MPTASVIIACYNCADTLGSQLEALARQDYLDDFEVIVVDNRSTDALREVVDSYAEAFPSLRLVEAVERQGVAHAKNVGAKHASNELLLFCDADDVVGDGWMHALVSTLEESSVAVGPLERTALNSPSVVESRGAVAQGLVSRFSYLPHAFGGNFGIWKRIHDSVGGFDEELGTGQDTEYFWRLQLNGYELKEASTAWIHNRLPDSFGGTYRQARRLSCGLILVHKRYRKHGLAFPSYFSIMKGSVRSLLSLPRVVLPSQRIRVAWLLGWRVGQIQGIVKHRGA